MKKWSDVRGHRAEEAGDDSPKTSVPKKRRGKWVVWAIVGVMILAMVMVGGIFWVTWTRAHRTTPITYGKFLELLGERSIEAVRVRDDGTSYELTGTVANNAKGQWGLRVGTRVTKSTFEGNGWARLREAAQAGGASIDYAPSGGLVR